MTNYLCNLPWFGTVAWVMLLGIILHIIRPAVFYICGYLERVDWLACIKIGRWNVKEGKGIANWQWNNLNNINMNFVDKDRQIWSCNCVTIYLENISPLFVITNVTLRYILSSVVINILNGESTYSNNLNRTRNLHTTINFVPTVATMHQ